MPPITAFTTASRRRGDETIDSPQAAGDTIIEEPSASGIDIIAPVTAGDKTGPAPVGGGCESRAVPTLDEVLDQLNALGHPPNHVAILLGLFTELADLVHEVEAGEAYIEMDMDVHDLLMEVMADGQVAQPGTIHDMINRHYLPEGYTFVHGRRDYCTIEIVRA